MRVEAIIVAAGAGGANRDMPYPGRACLARYEGAKVDDGGLRRARASESLVDVGADFVAAPADGRPKVHSKLRCRNAAVRERGDSLLDDPARGATPARVQEGRRARRMNDEDRDAVGDRYGHRRAAVG